MPKISVIIPTYNRAHLLDRAIKSIFGQTLQPDEILVIDDASTDDTKRFIEGVQDTRIQYLLHTENKGGSAARNTGIEHATGEYIAFLDSDDEWLPDKLEKQMNVLRDAPKSLGVVYTDYLKRNWKKQAEIPKYSGNISRSILVYNYVGTTSTAFVRKECFEKVGVFDESLPSCQDWDMWIRIAEYYEFHYLPETLVYYYHQDESISMNRKATNEGMRKISEKYHDRFKTLPKKIRAEHYFYLGKNYWWKKNIHACLQCFIKSIIVSPSILPAIIDFTIIKKCKKLWRSVLQ